MSTLSRFTLAVAAVPAFTAVPASAQEMARVAPGEAQLAQLSEELDDAALLQQVLDALPAGVTLDTATDEELAAAVRSVIATYDADPVDVASGVLSVVAVALDSIGRTGAADAVFDAVVKATLLTASQQGRIIINVAMARRNPSPSQLAATAFAIAQTQPGGGEGDGESGFQEFAKNEDGLGQDVFQENANQVSGD